MASVKIGENEIELRPPVSVTVRYEVTAGRAHKAAHRALACALALCSVQIQTWVGGKPFDGDVLDYGRRVIDHLVEAGAKMREIVAAGKVAWELCAEGLPTDSEVKAAEDFSKAPAAPATS